MNVTTRTTVISADLASSLSVEVKVFLIVTFGKRYMYPSTKLSNFATLKNNVCPQFLNISRGCSLN